MAAQRERILFVVREFTAGGAANLALEYMRRLVPRHDIDLLATGACDEKTLGQLPAGTAVFKLDPGTPEVLCPDFLATHRDSPVFRRDYRAALATAVFPEWHACLAVNLVRAARKLVFLVDEGLAAYPRLPLWERQAVDGCIGAADMILTVSTRLRGRMAENCPPLACRPWRTLRPPVDVDNIVLQSRRPSVVEVRHDLPAVLTVSRLMPDKQVLQCLRIHHGLRQAGVEFRWHIAGAGPEEPMLRAETGRLGMADAFLIHGYVENVYTLMLQCDCFALFSASEGCPTVVIEALLLGCPVIMTDVNGADELIDNGRTGIIVPNNEEAIARGLSRLVGDAALRARLRGNIAAGPPIADVARETAFLVEKIGEPPPPASGTPEVSILIPTFNHERYIDRAIASALMQDFPSLEVIVADDASTDGTEAVARKWSSDPRFRYARNGRNLGRVDNYRNALTAHARGKWALLLDGDDYLTDPGFIRRAWEALRRHGASAPLFAQAGHRVRYVADRRADVDITPGITGGECVMTGVEYLRFVFDTGFFTHLGTLYNREAAIRHGFYTANISSSDMDSLLRLALEGNVVVLDTVAGCWVQHGQNTSSNLPLRDVYANARIFRRVARMAARSSPVPAARMEESLTQYEARTLIHLFGETVGKSARGPFDAVRMLFIAFRVNPRLLLHRRLMSAVYRDLRRLWWLQRMRWREGAK